MPIRHLESTDFEFITSVVDQWWGGRPVRHLLPRLFFQHFHPTSFVFEEAGSIQAFLIGLRSQTDPAVAYIHFIGVSPSHRGKGLGRLLYNHFFQTVSALGCKEAHCITSPVNTGSVAFHKAMGFVPRQTGSESNGSPVVPDYEGPGQPRVAFQKSL